MTLLPPHITDMIEKEATNRFDADDIGDGQSCAHGYRVGATAWAEKCMELATALEFYADMKNWRSVTDGSKQYLFIDKEKGDWEYAPGNELMIQTGGSIARQALAKFNGGEK